MKDLREQGRIILAHGEVTGHMHEVVTAEGVTPDLALAQFFEEPDGTRVLLVLGDAPVILRHDEHAPLMLDPQRQTQVAQGDVLLTPGGEGRWTVRQQVEWTPEGFRAVQD